VKCSNHCAGVGNVACTFQMCAGCCRTISERCKVANHNNGKPLGPPSDDDDDDDDPDQEQDVSERLRALKIAAERNAELKKIADAEAADELKKITDAEAAAKKREAAAKQRDAELKAELAAKELADTKKRLDDQQKQTEQDTKHSRQKQPTDPPVKYKSDDKKALDAQLKRVRPFDWSAVLVKHWIQSHGLSRSLVTIVDNDPAFNGYAFFDMVQHKEKLDRYLGKHKLSVTETELTRVRGEVERLHLTPHSSIQHTSPLQTVKMDPETLEFITRWTPDHVAAWAKWRGLHNAIEHLDCVNGDLLLNRAEDDWKKIQYFRTNGVRGLLMSEIRQLKSATLRSLQPLVEILRKVNANTGNAEMTELLEAFAQRIQREIARAGGLSPTKMNLE